MAGPSGGAWDRHGLPSGTPSRSLWGQGPAELCPGAAAWMPGGWAALAGAAAAGTGPPLRGCWLRKVLEHRYEVRVWSLGLGMPPVAECRPCPVLRYHAPRTVELNLCLAVFLNGLLDLCSNLPLERCTQPLPCCGPRSTALNSLLNLTRSPWAPSHQLHAGASQLQWCPSSVLRLASSCCRLSPRLF